MKIFKNYVIDLIDYIEDLDNISTALKNDIIIDLVNTNNLRGELNPDFSLGNDEIIRYLTIDSANTVMYINNIKLLYNKHKIIIDIIFDSDKEYLYEELEKGNLEVLIRGISTDKYFQLVTFDLFSTNKEDK